MSYRFATGRLLLVYSGPTSNGTSNGTRDHLYDDNFRFFLDHGLPSSYHGCGRRTDVVLVDLIETRTRDRGEAREEVARPDDADPQPHPAPGT